MGKAIKSKLWLALGAFVAGALMVLAYRSLASLALAVVLGGVSSTVLAGAVAGGGKAGSVHVSALIGAAAGSAMLWLQLRTRPLADRIILPLGAFVAAYYGGVLSSEVWPDVGPGGAGVAGTLGAFLVVPLLEALMALLRDIKWLQRVLGARAGVVDNCQSCTESVDNRPPAQQEGQ